MTWVKAGTGWPTQWVAVTYNVLPDRGRVDDRVMCMFLLTGLT